jgi:fructokinase
MVCAIGDSKGNIISQHFIPTRNPKDTIPEVIAYFKDKEIQALGIGAFGPVDVNKESTTYGHILDTPKLEWVNFDLVGSIQKELKVPMGLDTDVNSSCLGEMTFGCAKGLDSVLYLNRNRCRN